MIGRLALAFLAALAAASAPSAEAASAGAEQENTTRAEMIIFFTMNSSFD